MNDLAPERGTKAKRSAKGPKPADRKPADSEPLEEIGFVQVAFAGHNRSEDLGNPVQVAGALEDTMKLLRQAGVRNARLVTGLARGADLLAAQAWQRSGLGPIHGVLSFLDDDLDPWAAKAIESSTWLDGAATQTTGRNAYLAQTRWLIGAADLLIVVWTGEHARGAGGTADAVRLALEHGLPVLWIKPGEPKTKWLIRPEHLDEDFGFLEFLEELRNGREPLVRPATAANLNETLVHLGLEAREGHEADADEGAAATSPISRSYALFRRFLGGRAPPYSATPLPADLAEQPGFARLTWAQTHADRHANALGAIHRSHQVLLLAVAILAAFAGSASALWPGAKLAMVAVELVLAFGALFVWLQSERGARHNRWGEARRLAEELRLERVAWVLGLSTVPQGVRVRHRGAGRRLRRHAGLPNTAYTPERVAAWGGWAADELIAGQAAYHHGQALINGRISHRVHQVDTLSFSVLMTILLSYLGFSLWASWRGGEPPHWLSAAVVVSGAIVPAIGAAGLALEATLALSEESQRSRVLSAQLQALKHDIVSDGPLETFQVAAKAAIRLQRAQEEHWTEGVVRRRLIRGS